MRRSSFLILVVIFGIPAATFGRAASSDSKTLKALLTEVHALRQELQISLGRVQSAQILLSRLQIQEEAVTRASQHFHEARSKVAEVQVVRKSEEGEVQHLDEHTPTADENSDQVQEAINGAKSDLAASTEVEQQRQAAENEAEQKLQFEQDKLNKIETQLDELVRKMDNATEQSGSAPH